jgi:hypothetical protein
MPASTAGDLAGRDNSQSNSLADLAARIHAEHEAFVDSMKRGLEHARRAGGMLIEAKRQIPHGQWLPWLGDHCQVSMRSAQAYMQVRRRRQQRGVQRRRDLARPYGDERPALRARARQPCRLKRPRRILAQCRRPLLVTGRPRLSV